MPEVQPDIILASQSADLPVSADEEEESFVSIPENVKLIPVSNQTRELQTIIREKYVIVSCGFSERCNAISVLFYLIIPVIT